jgi:hypothetical protein
MSEILIAFPAQSNIEGQRHNWQSVEAIYRALKKKK